MPANTETKSCPFPFESAYQPVLDGMLETLGRLGIHFDRFTKESLFVINGDVANLMDELGGLDINGVAENGAQFLDLGQRGLKGKTEFFYRRATVLPCTPRETSPTTDGSGRNATNSINVLGEDHKLQAQQVGLTLEELGERRPQGCSIPSSNSLKERCQHGGAIAWCSWTICSRRHKPTLSRCSRSDAPVGRCLHGDHR